MPSSTSATDAAARETAGPLAAFRRTWRLAVMTVWTPIIVGWEAVRALFFRGDRKILIDRAKHAWAIVSRHVLAVRAELVRGQRPVRKTARARLIVSNHRTPLDVVSLMDLYDAHFLANHKTRTAPVVGIAAIRMGTIFVDRDDRQSGVAAIRAMRRALGAGESIIIFPEGTTYRGDEVRPFKGGAFLAAKGLDVDVVPIGMAYVPNTEFEGGTLGAHARSFLSRPVNRVWIAIGDAMPLPTGPDVDEIIRSQVQALVHEARAASRPMLTSEASAPAPTREPREAP